MAEVESISNGKHALEDSDTSPTKAKLLKTADSNGTNGKHNGAALETPVVEKAVEEVGKDASNGGAAEGAAVAEESNNSECNVVSAGEDSSSLPVPTRGAPHLAAEDDDDEDDEDDDEEGEGVYAGEEDDDADDDDDEEGDEDDDDEGDDDDDDEGDDDDDDDGGDDE